MGCLVKMYKGLFLLVASRWKVYWSAPASAMSSTHCKRDIASTVTHSTALASDHTTATIANCTVSGRQTDKPHLFWLWDHHMNVCRITKIYMMLQGNCNLLLTNHSPKNALGIFFLKHFTIGAPNVMLGTKCLHTTKENAVQSGYSNTVSGLWSTSVISLHVPHAQLAASPTLSLSS